MADFNYQLKNNKILVLFTIFAFLYMSCFTSCSKSSDQEKTETAKKSNRVEKTEKSEAPKIETASNQETAESDNSTQSDKSDDPCAGCPPGVDEAAENAGQKKPLTQEELNQMADKLDRHFQALEEAVKEIPRDTFDPQAIVDKVGKDPEALFRWVRDNTCLVPYQGVLRGPIGVLMDKNGNSLDRALLLRELLRLAGYNARLARGNIGKQKAQNLLNRMRPPKKPEVLTRVNVSSDEFKKMVDKYTDEFQLDRERIRKIVDKITIEQASFAANINERVTQQTEYIYNIIKDLRKNAPLKEGTDTYNALLEHWWVQQENENRWMDMDPTLAEASLGETLTEPKETLDPKDLQEEAYHLVKIRLIVEQRADGKIKENTALEHTMKPSELFGKRIALRHVFVNWPEEPSILQEKQPIDKLKEIIAQEKEWLPVLDVGENQIVQSSFNIGGEINKNPGKKRKSGGPGGLAGGVFNALGGSEEKEADKESQLTAEWIEYEIHSPGVKTRKIRRQIFDFVGLTVRQEESAKTVEISESQTLERGMSLFSDAEILIQASNISDDFLSYLTATELLTNRELLISTLRTIGSLKNEELVNKLKELKPLPGPEYSLAAVRNSLSNYKYGVYLNSPNILVFSKGLNFDEKGELARSILLDFVSNEVAVYQVPNKEPFFINLYQGVLDTNAEALIMQSQGNVVENAAEMLFLSKEQNIEWQTITDPNSLLLQNETIGKFALASMRQDLINEYILLIPKKPIKAGQNSLFGWWRVNPHTGVTLGMGKKGAGQGFTEYNIKVAAILTGLGESICMNMFAIRLMDAREAYDQHKNLDRYQQDVEYAKADFLKCSAGNALTVWSGIWFVEGLASGLALIVAQAGGDIISML
jgi:hypothetical protein